MAEIEKSRRPPHNSPTVKQNNRMSGGRSRSNSRSSGSRVQPSFDQFDIAGTTSTTPERRPVPPPTFTSRNRYTHILILKSLNSTFETKYLVIPFKPDALKLGRPVVNSNINNNGGSGQGGSNKRDTNTMVRPDNGNFDSRVLSRNHASLSCDSLTGKIHIKDLNSSNGTFLNGNRINQEDIELKVGDVIDLGTDIDTKFEHRKISAFVEEISVIPLIDGATELSSIQLSDSNQISQKNVAKTVQGHTQDPSASIGKNISQSYAPTNYMNQGTNNGNLTASTAQRAAFEAAMFGDVNNLDLEDAVLGPETEILSGIFISNSIGTSPNLINTIKSLATEIVLEKKEYSKLKSIENFLVNYTTNLEYVNKLMIEMNDKQLIKLQNSLRQQYTEKHEALINETKEQIEKTKTDATNFKEACDEKTKNSTTTICNLKMEVEDLKTRLEVEKYKNSKFQNTTSSQKLQDSSSTQEKSVNTDNQKASEISSNKETRNYSDINSTKPHKGLINKTILTITAVSVGLLAIVLKYSSR